jgi:hypothetical protein
MTRWASNPNLAGKAIAFATELIVRWPEREDWQTISFEPHIDFPAISQATTFRPCLRRVTVHHPTWDEIVTSDTCVPAYGEQRAPCGKCRFCEAIADGLAVTWVYDLGAVELKTEGAA